MLLPSSLSYWHLNAASDMPLAGLALADCSGDAGSLRLDPNLHELARNMDFSVLERSCETMDLESCMVELEGCSFNWDSNWITNCWIKDSSESRSTLWFSPVSVLSISV